MLEVLKNNRIFKKEFGFDLATAAKIYKDSDGSCLKSQLIESDEFAWYWTVKLGNKW